jgi:multidrug efflux pump subunit AcrB
MFVETASPSRTLATSRRSTVRPSAERNGMSRNASTVSQVTGVSQTILRRMPSGTTPPLVVRTSPSSVPIVQLVMSSDTMSSGQLFDYARLTLRAQLQSVPGMRISLPYGGASRQVMVDLDPDALHAFDLTASEVSAVIGQQNLTLPSGSLREGGRELPVDGVAVPLSNAEFRLLCVFLERPEVILSRDQLLDLTSGRSAEVWDRSVDNQVSRLRRKIEDDPAQPALIKTCWGDGYQFVGKVRKI